MAMVSPTPRPISSFAVSQCIELPSNPYHIGLQTPRFSPPRLFPFPFLTVPFAGYAFLLFHEEYSVQALISMCKQEGGKYYYFVSSPTLKDKQVRHNPSRDVTTPHVTSSSRQFPRVFQPLTNLEFCCFDLGMFKMVRITAKGLNCLQWQRKPFFNYYCNPCLNNTLGNFDNAFVLGISRFRKLKLLI